MLEQRNIARNIDACRTHRHARYRLRLIFDVICTGMVFDMGFKIIPIALQPSEYHVGCFKANRAVRRDADGFCCFFEQLQRF